MRKTILPILLISFFLYFSLWPTIYEWNNRGRVKPVRHFELVHNFPTDYNLYLSKIRQGKEGSWLAKEKYTSEPHAGSLSQVLYVIIGRAWDWAHGQTPYVWLAYHAMRVFFGVLLLCIIWKFVGWIFPTISWRILAFLLVVTASTWPKFETVEGLPRLGGYMPWWSVIDSLQRITFIPHVLLGQALLVFILWVFGGGFVKKGPAEQDLASPENMGNWIFLGIIGFILGIIFPPALLFIYGVLALLVFFDKKRTEKIIFFLLSVPSVVYYSMLLTQYPWKRLVEFDVLHPTKFSFLEYFLALGPTLPLGLFGALLVFVRHDTISTRLRTLVMWVAAWLMFLVVFSNIPQQSPTRFTEMVPHVPLAILATYVFYLLRRFKLSLLVPVMIITIGLGNMFSSWLWQRDFVDHKLRADYPLVPKGAEVMYPLKDLVDAMMWLQIYTPRGAVVFSGQSTGNMIPVYSGNTVYIGHANTVNLEQKVMIASEFYTGKMNEQQALGWLRAEHIGYIVFGPEEREFSNYEVKDLRTFYPSLVPFYENSRVRLYRVQ